MGSIPGDEIDLNGVRVLVIRPAQQTKRLMDLIHSAGGEAVSLPVLAIKPPANPAVAKRLLDRLEDFQASIFTSANAVDGLFAICPNARFAPGAHVFAVGAATAAALLKHGIVAEQPPPSERSSEGLLRLAGLRAEAVQQRPVLIVKGEGGRDLLQQELRGRGAQLSSVDVYRRRQVDLPVDCITASGCHVVIASSATVLTALYQALDAQQRRQLLKLGVVAISERVAQTARELGFSACVVVAGTASDEGLLAALRDWQHSG